MPNPRHYWVYLYFLQSTAPPYLVKIGQSARPLRRYKELMTGCPVPLVPVFLIKANIIGEQLLHAAFADQWAHGEWYRPHANLKALVRGWKDAGEELLTPDLAERTLPPLATFDGNVGKAMKLSDLLECHRQAFQAEGLGRRSRSMRRPTLAWRSTLVV